MNVFIFHKRSTSLLCCNTEPNERVNYIYKLEFYWTPKVNTNAFTSLVNVSNTVHTLLYYCTGIDLSAYSSSNFVCKIIKTF